MTHRTAIVGDNGRVGPDAIHRRNRTAPRGFLRACGAAATSAGMLFLAWGYLHVRGDPYAYGDPYQPYLDSTVAALAVSVPALFFVALTGLAGLLAQGVVGRVGLLVVLVAAVGFVLAFTGAAVGVVRGIEGGLGWYDAYRWRQWPPSGRFGRTQHARESLLSVSPRQGTPGR